MNLPICPFCGNEDIQQSVMGFYCNECELDFNEDDLHPDDDYFQGAQTQTQIDPYEERIWDYITESAKRRFDYNTYQSNFPEYVENHMKDNILWEIIIRTAGGMDVLEITSFIFSNLALLGIMFPKDELTNFVAERQKDLGLEILAAKIATDSLNNGSPATSVLGQINSFLR